MIEFIRISNYLFFNFSYQVHKYSVRLSGYKFNPFKIVIMKLAERCFYFKITPFFIKLKIDLTLINSILSYFKKNVYVNFNRYLNNYIFINLN